MDTDDLRIEPWSLPKPPGDQRVGTSPHGIKVTHIPSGIEACVDVGQSQFVNREIAVNMIEAAVAHPRFREATTAVSVLKSGMVSGMPYTLYSDGSIEAQLPEGTLRFGSITELRNHIEQSA
jgi:protein subunit release factor A